MGVEEIQVVQAIDYLVPCATGIFIWATTIADFLQLNPKVQFFILELKNDPERLENLYSLYSTVITTLFGYDLREEEIKIVTFILDAMIFTKQPLDNNIFIRLLRVRSQNILEFIQRGFLSVIDSSPILHFHYQFFKDFLLHLFFLQYLSKLSAIQDQDLYEHQLAMSCLNTIVSLELHFNMYSLNSLSIKNVDIATVNRFAISSLILYLFQFQTDHLVQTQYEETLIKAVELVICEKLLFWIEVINILEKAHKMFAIFKKALEWPRLVVCLEFIFCIYHSHL